MEPIFHIAEAAAWDESIASGEYRVSTLGKTLEEVGFLHCSRRDQVAPVANARYRGAKGLVLLVIDRERLLPETREEDLEGTGEVFPHIYGPLNVDAVVRVLPFSPGPDGAYASPCWP